FFQAEDGIRDFHVTGVQTCALPICTVSTASGREIGYGRALVATSGTPGSADVDDSHGSGRVIPFRTVRDYERLRGLTSNGSPHEIGRASCREGEVSSDVVWHL